jgi:hypothetical protein
VSTPAPSDTAPKPRVLPPDDRLLSLLEETDAPVPDLTPAASPEPSPPNAESATAETPPDEPTVDAPVSEDEPATPPEPVLYPVVVDGQEMRVTLDELRAGYSRRADYTRKTQALAEQRRAAETEVAAAREARERYVDRLNKAEEFLAAQMGPEPNWDKLREELPDAEFTRAVADFQLRERKLDAVRRERDRVENERRQLAETEHRRVLAAEQEKLLAAIPEWRDPAKFEADTRTLVEFATRTYGMSAADLAGVTDHRAVLLLRDAKAAHDLRRAAMSKPAPAPPMAKPGAVVQKPKVSGVQIARERLRQTKSPRDAEALFLAAIESGEDI